MIRRLLPPGDPDHRYPRSTSARTATAVLNVAIGLRLLAPDDILGSVAGYATIALQFRYDWVLGLLLLGLGIVKAVSLYTDRWLRWAVGATSIAWLVWLDIAVAIAVENLSQIGSIAYLFIASIHVYAYAHILEWRDQIDRGQAGT